MEPVRSPRNPRIVEAARLHRARERKSTGLTLLEGPHLLAEAIAAGCDLRAVYVREGDTDSLPRASDAGLPVTEVSESVLGRLAGTEHPRGPVAVMAIPAAQAASRDTVVLAVTEPGNAGTLIRSAAAFEFDVAAVPGAVDLWAPKVLRSAAGGHFHTHVVAAEELTGGYIGLDAGAAAALHDVLAGLAGPAVVVVGNEAHGIPAELAARIVVKARLPMASGVESLNAAVAGSLAMYERYRTRSDQTAIESDPAAG